MKKNENFDELLFRLNENDEGVPLNDEDFDELIGDIKDKIDGIKYFISKCEAESERLKKDYLEPITRRKQACDNSVKSIKHWVVSCMKKQNMPYLEGDLFKIQLQERSVVKENGAIPLDSKSYLKYKNVMKRSYSWDKKALMAGIKSDPDKFQSVATIVKNPFVKFSIKQGEKKK